MFKLFIIICFFTNIIVTTGFKPPIFIGINSVVAKKTILRVFHGNDVSEGEYSYVIVLAYKPEEELVRLCCGSAINEYWVLTAGHCVERLPELRISWKDLYVWYGDLTVSALTTRSYSQVMGAHTHPAYKFSHQGNPDFIVANDISLLHVNKILNMKSYGSLSGVDHKTLIGLPVTFVGAGNATGTPADATRALQVGEGVVIACEKDKNNIKSQHQMFCTARAKHVMSVTPKCSNKRQTVAGGDSGGPLICDGKIVGVSSFGSTKSVVMGYMPISPYVDWIHNVVSEDIDDKTAYARLRGPL